MIMALDSFEKSVEPFHKNWSSVPEFAVGFHGALFQRLPINPRLQQEPFHKNWSSVPEFAVGFHGALFQRLPINPRLQLLWAAAFLLTRVCHWWVWWDLFLHFSVHNMLIENLVDDDFYNDPGVVWACIFPQVWRWRLDLILVYSFVYKVQARFFKWGLTMAVFLSS